MKTAIMFAGIDALDDSAQRAAMLEIPEVLARVAQAQKYLIEKGLIGVNLIDFMRAPENEFHGNLPLKAFACALTQVGLYDRYLKSNPAPDYLVGCSLGDTARTLCSGAVTFEEMVYGTYLFNSVGQTIRGGAIIRAKTRSGILTNEEVESIEARGLTVAVHQTPQHFLVSGPEAELRVWAEEVMKAQKYYIKPLYDKPLHSKGMQPALSAVKEAFAQAELKPWKIGLVSSVHRKVISTEDELKADIEDNMTGAVRWWQTFRWMVDKLGVTHFINIGPVPTLIHFAARIPLHVGIVVEDSLDEKFKLTKAPEILAAVGAEG